MKTTIKQMMMKFPGEKCAMLFTATSKTGLLIGTVVLKDFSRGECAEFSRLFVDEKCRRLGVARALLAAAADAARKGKASGMSGYVNQTNTEALAFYRREGFMPVYRFHDGDHLVWRPLL